MAQWDLLVARATGLEPPDLQQPTRLEPWRVRNLLAHVVRNVMAVTSALRRPAPESRSVSLAGYYDESAKVAAAIRDRAAGETASAEGLREAVEAAGKALAGVPDTRLVAVRLGNVTLEEFLVTRCVEGVVHGTDLAHAVLAHPHAWVEPAAVGVCAQHLAERVDQQVHITDRYAHFSACAVPVLDFVEWASGRIPAPHPELAAIRPVIT